MKTLNIYKNAAAFIVAVAFLMAGVSAKALDSYQDRRGIFYGFSGGGGGAFTTGGQGAALLFDGQIGGGATKNLTIALDLDIWLQFMGDYNNFIMVPGPEVNYFTGDLGFFVSGGFGMAVIKSFIKDGPNPDAVLGFDMSAGAGWEFFSGANAAISLLTEFNYIFLDGPDLASLSFSFGIKYY